MDDPDGAQQMDTGRNGEKQETVQQDFARLNRHK
jgi:hypothetical protein